MKDKNLSILICFGFFILCISFGGILSDIEVNVNIFPVFVLLAIIAGVCLVMFLLLKIIKHKVDKERRKIFEQRVLNVADKIMFYRENKNINIDEYITEYINENTENLKKYIDMPKKMNLTNENEEIFIKYKKLIFNVNTGRFICKDV